MFKLFEGYKKKYINYASQASGFVREKPQALIYAISIFLLLVFLIAAFLIYAPTPKIYRQSIEVSIPEGAGVSEIARLLKSQGAIYDPSSFVLYVWAKGHDTELKAGDYEFPRKAGLNDIERMMVEGLAKYKDVKITIFEGSNIWEVDRWLVTGGIIKANEFSSRYFKEEGGFFPDTYRFKIPNPKFQGVLNVSEEEIKENREKEIEAIAEKMRLNYKNKTEELLKGKTDKEKRDLIVIASMLEKEARDPEDMAIIAGIISKRMAIGMKLEIDATVGHGWCLRLSETNNFSKDCKVSEAPIALEIKKDSPYNTYKYYGLPPGPISNPGLNAIVAALNPKKTDYLYYLSPRDGSTIIYSKTGREHAENRRKYLGI